MTSPRTHMRMRNTLFCLKRQVIGLVHNHFYIRKMIGMVVYNVQTKAELKTAGLLLHKTFFCTL